VSRNNSVIVATSKLLTVSATRSDWLKCPTSDFLHHANLKSVAPVCHLAGGHRPGIHESRLRRTYESYPLSDLSSSIWNGSCTLCSLARRPSQNRAFCRLLHTECSSVSFLACNFPAA